MAVNSHWNALESIQDTSARNAEKGIVEKPAAVTVSEREEIKDIKKSSHHPDCQVEFLGTAQDRSQKNAAVVFKSMYGETSKHVYDTHTQILSASNTDLTTTDFAQGFKPFSFASAALKKSHQRKSAIKLKKVEIFESGAIDKLSTKIIKSIVDEPVDYFLIGQGVNSYRRWASSKKRSGWAICEYKIFFVFLSSQSKYCKMSRGT